MSEYQYYEFVAVDRPLGPAEMRTLREFSSRAKITPHRFVNSYEWGDFKGDPVAWVRQWFDGFLYLANWGTHELMLRIPASVLDASTALRYSTGGEHTSVLEAGEHVILSFRSEDEEGDWVEDGSGHLSSILPLRDELAAGDLRALYLGWLVGVTQDDCDEDEPEPPVPAGLRKPTAAQREFVEFLRIDPDLIRAAAERSPPLVTEQRGIEDWIATLDDVQKAELLARVARGEGVRAEMMRRFAEARPRVAAAADDPSPRTVRDLRVAAERIAVDRQRQAGEKAAADRERHEEALAAAHARELDALASREEETWQRAEFLIKGGLPHDYDEAVRLLVNLRDLAARDGDSAAAVSRVQVLGARYARKHSFIRRMIAAGLLPERSA